MRAALYARVSTKDQNLKRQTDEMRAFAKARGWEVVVEETDKLSGTKDDRPGLARVMKLAKARKIDVVIVQSLDRFGRSVKHLVTTLADLEALGVQFVSVSQGFDTTTPTGRLQMQMLAAFAEFERTLLVERVLSGLARARREGKTLGRPQTAVDSARVKRLRKQGSSWTDIAEVLQVPRTVCQRAGGK